MESVESKESGVVPNLSVDEPSEPLSTRSISHNGKAKDKHCLAQNVKENLSLALVGCTIWTNHTTKLNNDTFAVKKKAAIIPTKVTLLTRSGRPCARSGRPSTFLQF